MDRSSLLQLIQEQLDPENTGFIGVETFASLVHSHELPLDPAKLDMLVALAQGNDEGQVCYQELVDLISSKRSSSFKRAIANGQRALPRDGLLDETGLGFYKRFVRYVAYEILPCEMDRRWYFYQHRTCPPPVFMAAVTLTQAGAAGVQCAPAADDWSPLGDGARHPAHQLPLPGWCPGRLPHCLHHGHAGPPGWGLRGGLCTLFSPSRQRCHELGRDALPLQAAADGAGTGVHELGGGSCRLASLLPTTAGLGSPAQLHGALGRGHCGHQHGADHPAQLRGEPAGPVRLVGPAPLLWHLPPLRCLLEHFCL
ncbi:rhomboid-related protein 1 isoform X3 [Patagioenas fasciata]|uniref:rhomboid-related protein 1 isoform X3 n=1 Tax=Patagioenas fasciata TaxID=372321 RepID=UPI003A9A1FB9